MTVFDVAEAILQKAGPMTAMKLQKLVYYAQAWSLVWDERPLFDARIEAWANGPVCRQLYAAHRQMFQVQTGLFQGDPRSLDPAAIETIDRVVEFYGKQSAQWLSDLSHLEQPWQAARARAGVAEGTACEEEITLADMHEYYSGLQNHSADQNGGSSASSH